MFETLAKSQYTMGYDPKFKEPETIAIIEAVENAYIAGYSRNTIRRLLVQELGLKGEYADAITAKGWKSLHSKGGDREDGMKTKNLARLEHIYHKAMETGDLKNAIAAVDQLNKLCKLYTNKVEVSTNDFEFTIGETKGE